MNTKVILGGGLVALLLIGGLAYWFWPEAPAPAPVEPQSTEPVTLTLVGVITEVNFEQVAFDGPSLLTMSVSGTNESRVVAVPSMALPLCPAAADIADAYQLAPGDRIEVRGTVSESGQIEPCAEAGHYLKASRTEEKTEFGFSFTYKKGPNGYVLEENTLTSNDDALEMLYSAVFTNTADYAAFVAAEEPREGPQNYQVRVYENGGELDPAQWIEAYAAESNQALMLGEPEETVIGGANAIRYVTDGLYPLQTFVVAKNEFVYMIVGMYDDPQSLIATDFSDFVASLVFLATPEAAATGAADVSAGE